jgi:hypothetical protein
MEPLGNDVAQSLERLSEQIEVVGEILDEIREEIQWAVRNGEWPRLDRLTVTAEDWIARLRAAAISPDPAAKGDVGRCLRELLDSPEVRASLAEPIRQIAVELQEVVAAEEARGEPYCCPNPNLQWINDASVPGVVCTNCDFVVAEGGDLVVYKEEEIGQHQERTWERQQMLFEMKDDEPEVW